MAEVGRKGARIERAILCFWQCFKVKAKCVRSLGDRQVRAR